jgi:hypothetical protein
MKTKDIDAHLALETTITRVCDCRSGVPLCGWDKHRVGIDAHKHTGNLCGRAQQHWVHRFGRWGRGGCLGTTHRTDRRIGPFETTRRIVHRRGLFANRRNFDGTFALQTLGMQQPPPTIIVVNESGRNTVK